MNKSELISEVAKIAGVSKTDAGKVIDATLQAVTSELKNGGKVQLVGFGTFQTRSRKATSGRNPQTGAAISIPESTLPVFKAGKVLKDSVSK